MASIVTKETDPHTHTFPCETLIKQVRQKFKTCLSDSIGILGWRSLRLCRCRVSRNLCFDQVGRRCWAMDRRHHRISGFFVFPHGHRTFVKRCTCVCVCLFTRHFFKGGFKRATSSQNQKLGDCTLIKSWGHRPVTLPLPRRGIQLPRCARRSEHSMEVRCNINFKPLEIHVGIGPAFAWGFQRCILPLSIIGDCADCVCWPHSVPCLFCWAINRLDCTKCSLSHGDDHAFPHPGSDP